MGEDVRDWYRLEQYKFRRLFDLVLEHNGFEIIEDFWKLFYEQTWTPIDKEWEK
tara:strand:- start:1115 stop:1276 length:162 start_codon:yes stop_codon:yes gene_type:complete